jgi:peroxin-3
VSAHVPAADPSSSTRAPHPHPHARAREAPAYLPAPPAPHYAALLDAPFLALLDETRRILGSPDFARVLEVSLDQATAILFEGLEKNVFRTGSGGEGGEERIRLAGLLPGLARWSQLALEGLPNELVDVRPFFRFVAACNVFGLTC